MNLKNLQRLQRFGIRAEVVAGVARGSPHIRIHAPVGRVLGIPVPPRLFDSDAFSAETADYDSDRREFEEHDPACAVVSKALTAYARAAQTAQATLADRNLSPEGRAKVIREAFAAALGSLAERHAQVIAVGAEVTRLDAQIRQPPAPTDGQAFIDVEARTLFRSLPDEERLKILADIGRPEYSQILLALKRSPLPLSTRDAELVDNAWSERVAREKPAQFEAVQIGKANAAWAEGVVRVLADALAFPRVPTLESSALTELDAYRAVRAHSPGVLGFHDAQIAALETTAAAADAKEAA